MRLETEKVIRDIIEESMIPVIVGDIDRVKIAIDKTVKKLADLHEQPVRPERTSNDLLADISETFTTCHEIARKKNSDYGGGTDPYNNFRNTKIVGVSVQDGIMVRLTDKFSRIATLLKRKAEVSDESIEDTINDAINYFAILKSTIKRNIQ